MGSQGSLAPPSRASPQEAREETYRVRGEAVTVDVAVPVCPVCGETVSIASRDDEILDRVYRECRRRRGMLQPEEIAELRAHYGLSQRALARLMDWGLVTVQRYESGRLQDSAHDCLAGIVAWFGQNIRGQFFKTWLAKLLWLADFGHFRREGRSK